LLKIYTGWAKKFSFSVHHIYRYGTIQVKMTQFSRKCSEKSWD